MREALLERGSPLACGVMCFASSSFNTFFYHIAEMIPYTHKLTLPWSLLLLINAHYNHNLMFHLQNTVKSIATIYLQQKKHNTKLM